MKLAYLLLQIHEEVSLRSNKEFPFYGSKNERERNFLISFSSFKSQKFNIGGKLPTPGQPPRADNNVPTLETQNFTQILPKYLGTRVVGGGCSVAAVSSVAVSSSHLSTNRMRCYFFQSKCVVIASSSCDFPTRGGL